MRSKLSYANVVASIALFGVLAGGGAYAASKIGSNQIKKNAVKAKHIKKGQVKDKAVADLRWRDLSLKAGWTADEDRPPQAARDAQGVVHLRGFATVGGGPRPALTASLPAAFRPSQRTVAPVYCEGPGLNANSLNTGRILILTTAIEVGPGTGDDCYQYSLDGVSYGGAR